MYCSSTFYAIDFGSAIFEPFASSDTLNDVNSEANVGGKNSSMENMPQMLDILDSVEDIIDAPPCAVLEADVCFPPFLPNIPQMLDILDSVEDIIDAPPPCAVAEADVSFPPFLLFEPTPIGPNGIQDCIRPRVEVVPSTIITAKDKMTTEDDIIDIFNTHTPTPRSNLLCNLILPDNGNSASRKHGLSQSVSCDRNVDLLSSSSDDHVMSNTCPQDKSTRFRQYQSNQWHMKFEEMVEFKQRHGHCIVPSDYPINQRLAQWVKRQRYQYKLKKQNSHSTLTSARQVDLDELGFVWDSHGAAWQERFEALKQFRWENGHCRIPLNHEDKGLVTWVKCQRRSMIMLKRGRGSAISRARVELLNRLGFDWTLRRFLR